LIIMRFANHTIINELMITHAKSTDYYHYSSSVESIFINQKLEKSPQLKCIIETDMLSF
jgi:hypothetical protein